MPIASMQDAYRTIADAAGLDRLDPNAEGVVELVIADRLSIYLSDRDDGVLEMSASAASLDGALNREALSEMLRINATQTAGRLALDPDTGRVVFCQRIALDQTDAQGLLRALDRFTHAAARWNAVEGAALLDRARANAARAEQEFNLGGGAIRG